MKVLKTVLILILVSFMMSGCGKKDISGTYVSERNSDEYLKFEGKSKVEYYLDGKSVTGSFRVIDNAVIVTFDSEEIIMLEAKDDKTLYDGMNAFVKKGFWEKHWWKFVIAFIVWGIISFIYKKITGRELEDDIEKLSDKLTE